MRILVIAKRDGDFAEASIAKALAANHEVTTFDYERRMILFRTERLYRLNIAAQLSLKAAGLGPTYFSDRALLEFARGKRFDLVVVVALNLVPSAVLTQLCRKTGALLVGWFTDAIVNLGKADFVSAPYLRVFFKDKTVVDRFRSGLDSDRYEFLPQAFDPALHRPVDDAAGSARFAADVATFGNSYPYRAKLMADLLEADDIRTVIYGQASADCPAPLRKRYRAPVYSLEKSSAMRAASIALNSNHFAELGGVNKRTFELAGIGAFQLTDGPMVHEYFEPDSEVATFRGPRDLIEKVRYWLAHPDERRAIAQAGLRRAWSEHTYQHRLNELFQRIPELRGERRLAIPAMPAQREVS